MKKIGVPDPVHDWLNKEAQRQTAVRDRTVTIVQVIEQLVEHAKATDRLVADAKEAGR